MIFRIIKNNKFLFVLFTYIFFESYSFLCFLNRYKYFTNLRYFIKVTKDTIYFRDKINKLLVNNKSWYEYAELFYKSFGINLKEFLSKDKLLNLISNDNVNNLRNSNKESNFSMISSQGNLELIKSYKPLFFRLIILLIKKLGELKMYYLGFSKTCYNTNDGWYSVWSRNNNKNNNDNKPLIFLPGWGLGSILYINKYYKFDRDLHIIEVPNLTSFFKSKSHCT